MSLAKIHVPLRNVFTETVIQAGTTTHLHTCITNARVELYHTGADHCISNLNMASAEYSSINYHGYNINYHGYNINYHDIILTTMDIILTGLALLVTYWDSS